MLVLSSHTNRLDQSKMTSPLHLQYSCTFTWTAYLLSELETLHCFSSCVFRLFYMENISLFWFLMSHDVDQTPSCCIFSFYYLLWYQNLGTHLHPLYWNRIVVIPTVKYGTFYIDWHHLVSRNIMAYEFPGDIFSRVQP